MAQLVYTFHETRENDLTDSLWPLVICTQVVQCTSIPTACIPYLQPFPLSLESAVLKNDDLRHKSTKNSHASGDLSKMAPRSKLLCNSKDTHNALAQRAGRALLPQYAADESSHGQIDISWDSRRASSQFEVIGCVTPAHIAVDTRRRELEGYWREKGPPIFLQAARME